MSETSETKDRSKLYFVLAGDLHKVQLDEYERTPEASTLMELLVAPLGDPPLVALRQAVSSTYAKGGSPSNEARLLEIRRLAVKALGELGDELELLDLPRVDADKSFEQDQAGQIFKYVVVRAKELRRKVTVEGQKRKVALADLFMNVPADPALRALRSVLSLTFREATTPRQQECILEEIRYVSASVLVPYNELLEEIEVEPVAMPTRRRFVDGVDTFEDDEEGEAK